MWGFDHTSVLLAQSAASLSWAVLMIFILLGARFSSPDLESDSNVALHPMNHRHS